MANNIQTSLFDDAQFFVENPLTRRRVGFIGKFKNRAALVRKVKEYGAAECSKEGLTRDTQILIVGTDVKQETWNRLTCYEHDGWHPLQITESDLTNIFSGQYKGFETPLVASKKISIDMSYYNWTPPIVDEEDDNSYSTRCSSPMTYNSESNPVYGLELYVPGANNAKIDILRQIVGNFGGYANAEYYEDANAVLLSDETLNKLKQGVKDEVILHLEDKYNNSSSSMFNIQFTCESDFLAWVRKRVETTNDDNTKKLLDAYLSI